jgi:hypothetical protein
LRHATITHIRATVLPVSFENAIVSRLWFAHEWRTRLSIRLITQSGLLVVRRSRDEIVWCSIVSQSRRANACG